MGLWPHFFMDIHIIIMLTIGGLSFLGLLTIIMSNIISRRIRRKYSDKILVENHKHSVRPPTWRFQKYHPSRCPHQNGIYRKVLVGNDKKTIFVCADCVDAIHYDEIKHRDKFKK